MPPVQSCTGGHADCCHGIPPYCRLSPEGTVVSLAQAEPAWWGTWIPVPRLQLSSELARGKAEAWGLLRHVFLMYKVTRDPSHICYPPLHFSWRGARRRETNWSEWCITGHYLSAAWTGLRNWGPALWEVAKSALKGGKVNSDLCSRLWFSQLTLAPSNTYLGSRGGGTKAICKNRFSSDAG